MRVRSLVVTLIAMGTLVLAEAPPLVGAVSPRAGTSAATGAVASVRWIYRGVTVRPPNHPGGKGKKNQKLYNQYGVQTGTNQRTSLGFPDLTLLHVNQQTSLVLRNPHLTQVTKGEVDQVVEPGTTHQIQTASAVASAIGTEFDVRVKKKLLTEVKRKKGKKTARKREVVVTEVIVAEGVVDVRNARGDVAVRANQEVTVVQGQAPSRPERVNARSATKWTKNIPPPDIPPGKNVALHDNGGRVVSVSSDRKPAADLAAHAASAAVNPWAPGNLIDGLTTTGWSSKQGKNKNQSAVIQLGNGNVYKIVAVVIDPAATAGLPASDDLKRFQIWVSTTGTDASDFTRVLTRKTQQQDSLQTFRFSKDVFARYVKLVALNNYGGKSITVAELEAVSRIAPVTLPTPTPTPPTPVPTATGLPVYTATPAPTATPTATPVGSPTPTSTPTPGTPIVFPSATPTATPAGTAYKAVYTATNSCPTPPMGSEVLRIIQSGSSITFIRSSGETYSGVANGNNFFRAFNSSGTAQYNGLLNQTGGPPLRLSYVESPNAAGCAPSYSVALS